MIKSILACSYSFILILHAACGPQQLKTASSNTVSNANLANKGTNSAADSIDTAGLGTEKKPFPFPGVLANSSVTSIPSPTVVPEIFDKNFPMSAEPKKPAYFVDKFSPSNNVHPKNHLTFPNEKALFVTILKTEDIVANTARIIKGGESATIVFQFNGENVSLDSSAFLSVKNDPVLISANNIALYFPNAKTIQLKNVDLTGHIIAPKGIVSAESSRISGEIQALEIKLSAEMKVKVTKESAILIDNKPAKSVLFQFPFVGFKPAAELSLFSCLSGGFEPKPMKEGASIMRQGYFPIDGRAEKAGINFSSSGLSYQDYVTDYEALLKVQGWVPSSVAPERLCVSSTVKETCTLGKIVSPVKNISNAVFKEDCSEVSPMQFVEENSPLCMSTSQVRTFVEGVLAKDWTNPRFKFKTCVDNPNSVRRILESDQSLGNQSVAVAKDEMVLYRVRSTYPTIDGTAARAHQISNAPKAFTLYLNTYQTDTIIDFGTDGFPETFRYLNGIKGTGRGIFKVGMATVPKYCALSDEHISVQGLGAAKCKEFAAVCKIVETNPVEFTCQ